MPMAFQHESCLICIYNIDPKDEYPFVHLWFPRNEFDEVIEREGWIFARKAKGYIGVRFLQPYYWAEEGLWVGIEATSDYVRNGILCECGRLKVNGAFREFQDELLHNQVEWNPDSLSILYYSKRNGLIELSWDNGPKVNGRYVDISSYARMDSPYTRSDIGSGVYKISKSGKTLILDFIN